MKMKKGKMMWWVIGIVAVLIIFRKRIPALDAMISKWTSSKQPAASVDDIVGAKED